METGGGPGKYFEWEMATALNSVAGPSAASEAFRKCSSDLLRGIQDPELLAWELYSDDVVSETVVDEVSVLGLSAFQRKTKLLSAVRNEIAVDSAKFQNLLTVLKKKPPLKSVVEKLETTFKTCGTYISCTRSGGVGASLHAYGNQPTQSWSINSTILLFCHSSF